MTPEIAKLLAVQGRADAENRERDAKRKQQAARVEQERHDRETYVNVNDPAFAPSTRRRKSSWRSRPSGRMQRVVPCRGG